MKKLIRLIVGCLAAINVFMLTAFAAIPSPEVYTSVGEKSNLCEKSVKYSIAKEQSYARRGNFFDSADVIIRDEGNGNIGASAYANLRKPVKELYVSLYLDRYNKEKDTWQQVDYVDFEYTLEEYRMVLTILQLKLHLQIRSVVIITVLEALSPQEMMIGMKALDQLPKASGSNKPSNTI